MCRYQVRSSVCECGYHYCLTSPPTALLTVTFEAVGAAFVRHVDDVKRGRMVSQSDITHAHDAAVHETESASKAEAGEEEYVEIGSGEWKVRLDCVLRRPPRLDHPFL